MDIYEVVDYTNDEMYYTLGLFLSLEQAMEYIEEAEEPDRTISEFVYDHYEEIQILKRKIGWSQHGKPVKTIRREEKYNEEEDEYYWQRIK